MSKSIDKAAYLELIEEYRKNLEALIRTSDMHTNEYIVELSQELDKLIVGYHKMEIID